MRKIYGLLLGITLTACSVGPDYQRPEFWNINSGSKENKAESRQWYRIFGDETLNNLIAEALKNNPDVKIAAAKMRQARYMFNIRQTDYLPMVNIAGNYNYAYAPKYDELGDKTDYFKAGFDASWELDIWGAGRRQNERYAAQYGAALNNLADTLLSLTAEVADNYVGLRMTQEQLRIAKENLHLQEDILRTVHEKHRSGLVEDMDLQQAEFAVQTTKSSIPQLEYDEKNYQNALAVLTGVLPDMSDIRQDKNGNMAAKTFRFDLRELQDIPFEAVRNRPDVKAAENMLIAKNAEVGQAVAALFPNVNISALAGWQGHLLRNLGRSENAAYGYSPAVNLPFLNWGKLTNQVKLSKEIKQEYLYMYQKSLLNAAQEIKNAVTAIDKEYQKNTALQKSVNNMLTVMSAMKIKYKEGLIEFSDLLSTEQNLLAAQNKLAASRGAVYENIIAFYKAIGGDYCSFIPRK